MAKVKLVDKSKVVIDDTGNIQTEIVEVDNFRIHTTVSADLVERCKAKLLRDPKAQKVLESYTTRKPKRGSNELLYALVKYALHDYVDNGLREIQTVVRKETAWDRLNDYLRDTINSNRHLLSQGYTLDDIEFEVITRSKIIANMSVNVQTVSRWLKENRDVIDGHHAELGLFDVESTSVDDGHSAVAHYARRRANKLKKMRGDVTVKTESENEDNDNDE